MKKSNKPFSATLLPLGTRAGLLTVPKARNTTYLLKIVKNSEEYQILFDVGSKRVLQNDYVDVKKLKAVFLSHAHLDHTIYLGLFIRRLKKEKRKEPLPIYCHENGWKYLKWWIRFFCFGIPDFVKHIPLKLEIEDPHLKSYEKECKTDLSQIKELDSLGLEDGLEIEIKVAPALHSVSSVVYRFNFFSQSMPNYFLDFMFSPDTSYSSEHLIPFAKNAKYWLLDTSFAKEIIDERYEWFQNHKRGGEIVCHSGPYYSGKICQEANVKNYIMGHYVWERYTDKYENVEDALISRAREIYDGNIIVSLDLKPISLELNNNKHNN